MTRVLLLGSAVVLTLAACATSYVVTAFVACGISGCSGGGFGPSYDPRGAQIGVVVTGLTLVPLALLLLPRRVRLGGAVATGLVGAVGAMLLLGLAPNGCPLGLERAPEGSAGPACTSVR